MPKKDTTVEGLHQQMALLDGYTLEEKNGGYYLCHQIQGRQGPFRRESRAWKSTPDYCGDFREAMRVYLAVTGESYKLEGVLPTGEQICHELVDLLAASKKKTAKSKGKDSE